MPTTPAPLNLTASQYNELDDLFDKADAAIWDLRQLLLARGATEDIEERLLVISRAVAGIALEVMP